MPRRLTETTPLSEAGTIAPTGRMRVHAITAGMGSSGYYSPDVLREAAAQNLIPAGTPMYLDHASQSERQDRPERSVRDIAAVFTESVTFDEQSQALAGEIRVFAPYQELLTEMAPYIGLSISGSATDITEGTVDGRRVPVVEGLASIDSVDWVTRAGRGGRVVALLESARAADRARARGVDEATMNDTQDALRTTLRDAHGGEDIYVWVRDFDDTQVWFEVESPDENGLYAQQYSGSGSAVELTGDRIEVRVVTTYVPVTRPGSTNTTTEESEEDTMPQIEEARLRELEEAHGRVPTLESERDTAIRERDQAITERDQYRAAEAARSRTSRASDLVRTNETRVNAAVVFTALEERGLLADLPLTTAGDLDEAAFTSRVNDAVTERLAGTGTITGHGGQSVSEAEAYTEFESDFFGTPKGA